MAIRPTIHQLPSSQIQNQVPSRQDWSDPAEYHTVRRIAKPVNLKPVTRKPILMTALLAAFYPVPAGPEVTVDWLYYVWAVLLVLTCMAAWVSTLFTAPGNWIIVGATALLAAFYHDPSGPGLSWWVVGAVGLRAGRGGGGDEPDGGGDYAAAGG